MSFNFLAAVTICSDFGAQENLSLSTASSSLCHEVMGPHAMILVFLNVERKLYNEPICQKEFLLIVETFEEGSKKHDWEYQLGN